MANTYLFGASGHGKVIKEILNANGVRVEAFIDDNLAVNECADLKVLHEYDGLSPVIVSIGVNRIRKVVVEKLEIKAQTNGTELAFLTAIHPSAVVSPSATIGEGTVVMAGAIVNANAVIGKHCIINTGATVDHECSIEDYCHISPNATLCGNVQIAKGVWVGAGTTVIQGISIGCWSQIGAGAVVINNIPKYVLAYGNPCKVVRIL